MTHEEATIKFISQKNSNLVLEISNKKTGAIGRFRFYKPLESLTVYFEGSSKPKVDACVFRMTDLCLYVERNAAWIYQANKRK